MTETRGSLRWREWHYNTRLWRKVHSFVFSVLFCQPGAPSERSERSPRAGSRRAERNDGNGGGAKRCFTRHRACDLSLTYAIASHQSLKHTMSMMILRPFPFASPRWGEHEGNCFTSKRSDVQNEKCREKRKI